MKLSLFDRERLYAATKLERGSHWKGDGACLMEMTALLAGEPHTDGPICACPVITRFAIGLNDALPDELRQMLKPYAPAFIGTRDGHEMARARYLAERAVHVFTPFAFRAIGNEAEARKWEAMTLPAATAAATAADAADAATAAATAAYAAADAYAADADAAAYAAAAAAAAYADAATAAATAADAADAATAAATAADAAYAAATAAATAADAAYAAATAAYAADADAAAAYAADADAAAAYAAAAAAAAYAAAAAADAYADAAAAADAYAAKKKPLGTSRLAVRDLMPVILETFDGLLAIGADERTPARADKGVIFPLDAGRDESGVGRGADEDLRALGEAGAP